MTTRHSTLFTLWSVHSGFGLYTTQRDAAEGGRLIAIRIAGLRAPWWRLALPPAADTRPGCAHSITLATARKPVPDFQGRLAQAHGRSLERLAPAEDGFSRIVKGQRCLAGCRRQCWCPERMHMARPRPFNRQATGLACKVLLLIDPLKLYIA